VEAWVDFYQGLGKNWNTARILKEGYGKASKGKNHKQKKTRE